MYHVELIEIATNRIVCRMRYRTYERARDTAIVYVSADPSRRYARILNVMENVDEKIDALNYADKW